MNSEAVGHSESLERPDFYDLAGRYVEECSRSTQPHLLLREWIRRYPEHASELADIAYGIVSSGDVTEPDRNEQLAIIETARRVVTERFESKKPISSLVIEAGTVGLNARQLAEALRIDIPLLAKLEQRLLDVATVPRTLIDFLAAALCRSTSEITAYLIRPQQLAFGAQYKSKNRPSINGVEPQSFVSALGSSKSISDTDRAFWHDQLKTEISVSDLN